MSQERALMGKLLINGRWKGFAPGEPVIEVFNPANGQLIGKVPVASAEDVESAIHGADRAFPGWSSETVFSRGERLRAAADAVIKNKEFIARLMTTEQGKPLRESRGEVEKSAAILRYYAEEGERVYGRIIPNAEAHMESRVIDQPLGPAACISPWNYPVELLAWKVGAALAAGCTVVVKVPSETPLSPTAFVGAMQEAGFPDGVIHLLCGRGSQIGSLLTGSPLIKKVAFTGSTKNGKRIARECADTLKHVSLELGGNLPMIVCEDADLDAAVSGALRRSFRNMGQVCIAINRIYVHRSIYEPFLAAFARYVDDLTIGDGLLENVDLGPMCTSAGLSTVSQHLEDAVRKGARLVCGGEKPQGKQYEQGLFFRPTILADVDHTMRLMREETFGPLVGVMPYQTVDEAMALANDSCYGLGAIVYTESLSRAERFATELNCGNIAINHVDAGVINAPYGGWKDSGVGLEHGPEGLYGYLHEKHIRVRSR